MRVNFTCYNKKSMLELINLTKGVFMNNVLKFVPKERTSENTVEQEGKLLNFPSYKSPLESSKESDGSENYENLEEFMNKKQQFPKGLAEYKKKFPKKVKNPETEYKELVKEFQKGMTEIELLSQKMDALMIKIEEYHDDNDDCGTLMF